MHVFMSKHFYVLYLYGGVEAEVLGGRGQLVHAQGEAREQEDEAHACPSAVVWCGVTCQSLRTAGLGRLIEK